MPPAKCILSLRLRLVQPFTDKKRLVPSEEWDSVYKGVGTNLASQYSICFFAFFSYLRDSPAPGRTSLILNRQRQAARQCVLSVVGGPYMVLVSCVSCWYLDTIFNVVHVILEYSEESCSCSSGSWV